MLNDASFYDLSLQLPGKLSGGTSSFGAYRRGSKNHRKNASMTPIELLSDGSPGVIRANTNTGGPFINNNHHVMDNSTNYNFFITGAPNAVGGPGDPTPLDLI